MQKMQATAGQAGVCLGYPKRVVDLLLEPMSFDLIDVFWHDSMMILYDPCH